MEMTAGVTHVYEDIDQLCRRLCQWVGTGQELLGRLAPRLVETVEDLRRRTDAAEREARGLRRDLEERDSELTRLRAEVEHLAQERVAIAEAVGAAMRKIGRLDVLGQPPEAPTRDSDR